MIVLSRKRAFTAWNESVTRLSKKSLWSAGLLVISSAALGGIAVALWNRRTLASIREAGHNDEAASTEQVKFFDYE